MGAGDIGGVMGDLSPGGAMAPWRSPLSRALHRNRSRPESRYFQLATVGLDGWPCNRTVVFRGFYPGGDRLMVATDTRSAKAQAYPDRPAAEVCWYFAKTREQFRLRGTLTLVTGEADEGNPAGQQRQALWQTLSDGARLQFLWPTPAQPRAPETAFTPSPPDPLIPPLTFALLLITVTEADHLELRGSPQNRWHYHQVGNQWQGMAINP